MNDSKIKISIIFPSYFGEIVLAENLNSIQNLNNNDEIELVIIDNNSKDATVDIIKSYKDLKINLIKQNENLGFAKACNIGVNQAKGEFIFITNQDVAFPKKFFTILLDLYEKLKKDREIILSPAVVFPGGYINYYGAKLHFLGFSYTPEMYQKIPEEKQTFLTLKAAGCSMFLKRDTFLNLKGFDPFFFMYHEDTDFSLKAIRHGLIIYTTNETMLLHQKIHMSINNFTYYYIERNRYICQYKNIESLINIIPYFIISEFMLLFQAILEKRLFLRFKVYKFLIQNHANIKALRSNKNNSNYQKLKKKYFNHNFESIVLGKFPSQIRILKYLLKIANLIF